MSADVVIRGVRAVFEDGVRPVDICIEGPRISSIHAAGQAPGGAREIGGHGLTALPGLIDMHSHHREPGFTHKEDIVTIGAQCAAGGVTVSVGMPNVSPPPTTAAILDEMLAL